MSFFNEAKQQTALGIDGDTSGVRLARKENLTSTEDINPTSQDIERGNLEESIGKLPPLLSKCCIYKVPKRLRKTNAEAYTPQVISIGPLHHGRNNLLAMEEHKLRYLQSFLRRTRKSIEYYVNVVKEEWVERARHSYAETIKFESPKFVEMILVDGVFIIELFLRWSHPSSRNETDQIFHKPWMISDLRRDIILLENQLPFFVLEGLFNLAFGSRGYHGLKFIELSHNFFASSAIKNNIPKTTSSEVEHFVDFLRIYYLPSSPRDVRPRSKGKIIECFLRSFLLLLSLWKRSPVGKGKIRSRKSASELDSAGVGFENDKSNSLPYLPTGEEKSGFRRSATELHKAGVKFQMMDTISNSLLDLQFTSGVFKIPHLQIVGSTESILRNLVAFEQCHHDKNMYISDYIYLMDGLINTPQDVELLAEKEIIENQLGDNVDVSTLFNNLGRGVQFNKETFYYSRICEDLKAYHKAPQHTWMATLKRDYCGSPWRIASTTAAIVLLVLTLIQTICSILSLVL